MSTDNWNREGSAQTRTAANDPHTKLIGSAIKHVETVGLSLGMDSSALDDVMSAAGVTKKQFGQVWQSSDAFLTDLYCELANQAQIDRANTQTLLSTWQYLGGRLNDLSSVEARRGVLNDVIRTAAEYNYEAVTSSNKWATYAALSTTILSWTESEERTRVLEALRASEFSFVDTMESFYRNVLTTIGFRLKPAFRDDYQPFVVAAAAVIEGLGIVRSTIPALVASRFDLPVEGGTEPWSVASLSFMGVVDAFIEPDPDFDLEQAISRLSTGVDVTPQHRTAMREATD